VLSVICDRIRVCDSDAGTVGICRVWSHSDDGIGIGMSRHRTKPYIHTHKYAHTHTHALNGTFFQTTQVSRYQKGKTNLDFTETRNSEWQRHQLDHMQVCTSLQTDNHTSTPPLSLLQARCPSCCPTKSIKLACKGCR